MSRRERSYPYGASGATARVGRMTAASASASWSLLVVAVLGSGCGDGAPSSEAEGPVGGNAGMSASGTSTTAAGMGGQASPSGGQNASGEAGASAGSSGSGKGGSPALPLQAHAIAATTSGTCALTADGAVHCWGLAPEVWQVPEGSFIELHGGSDGIMCAVRADRSVACFAEPMGLYDLKRQPSGKVGLLAIGDGAICATDLADAAFCNAGNVLFGLEPPTGALSSLSVGTQFACGVNAVDGSISCVGADSFGSCTFSPAFGQLDAPTGNFSEVSSGSYNSCALRVDGTLACWGMGKAGDTAGDPCFGEWSKLQSEPPEGEFRLVRSAQLHSCAIRKDGTVACWGAGTEDSCESASCRQARPPAGTFEQLALGQYHSCGMRADRTVECWGFDGDETTTPPAELQ